MKTSVFGKIDGKDVTLYSLENSKGLRADIMDYGAILVNLYVPDKDGNVVDVALGFDKAEDYTGNPSFFGAVVGPNANRIAGAKFTLNGKEYPLAVNDGENNLHSDHDKGYHKQFFDAVVDDSTNSVTFSLVDNATLGFPGNKKVSVTYTVTEDNELKLHYHVTSDEDTIINLTNHGYFNLAGHDAGLIEDHILTLNAAKYTPVVAGAIPTGELAPVAGTPMDFTTAKVIGKEINADFEQLDLVGGYDHNWVLDGEEGTLRQVAKVEEKTSGRCMLVFTDLPGIQFYAGNFIADQSGKGGVQYGKRTGLALETQYYPNTANQANFPSAVFGPNRVYDTTTVYQFV